MLPIFGLVFNRDQAKAANARIQALLNTLGPKDCPNGAILFCSEDVAEYWHPPVPLKGTKYWCDDHFDTSELRKALDISKGQNYGIITIDGSEALFGELQRAQNSNVVRKLTRVRPPRPIPAETRRGGQSALRYERLREEARLEFLRRVVEKAIPLFENCLGLILAGKADMKRRLLHELPRSFQNQVICIVDLSCDAADDSSLRLAADLARDSLDSDGHRDMEQALSYFMDLMHTNPGLCCYGFKQTELALEMGAVDQLLLDASRTHEFDQLVALADNHGTSVVQVKARSAASIDFCKGFGVGGCLRWPVEFDDFEELQKSPSQLHPPTQSDVDTPMGLPTLLRSTVSPTCLDESSGTKDLTNEFMPPFSSTSPAHVDMKFCGNPKQFNIVLAWLTEELATALGSSSDADALVAGVEVILGDAWAAEQGEEEARELLVQASDMLQGENIPEDIITDFVSRCGELRQQCN